MNRNLLLVLVLTLLTFAGSDPVAANATVLTPQTVAELIVDRGEVALGTSFSAGLSLHLKAGWHTYWRTPGDSGLPATLTWTLPSGFTAGPIAWPSPFRVPTGDLMSFGYEGQVVLPVIIGVGPNATPGPVDLRLHATWLACAEVCIPEEGDFAVPLTVKSMAAAPFGPGNDALLVARKQIPGPAPWPATIFRSDNILMLEVGPGLDTRTITSAVFFPDGDGVIANAAPQRLTLSSDRLTLRLEAGLSRLKSVTGVLAIDDSRSGRAGYEINAAVMPGDGSSSGNITLWLALIFAILGGLMLNIMPCVLPILVMKIFAITNQPSHPRALQRDAVAYAAGVVVAFTVLVVIILLLRAGGQAIGWGFQLQNPIFVALLADVMMVLGLNLSGVFVLGGGIAGVGQSLTMRRGAWGAFFTGLLAVIVATPCTAPFMGTAIGFAFAQSPVLAVAIFEGLALGLALPYLLIAFIPAFRRIVPRPGPWSERLKHLLAFGLYGAAAWLVWVLTQQLDPAGMAFALAGVLCVGFAAWSWGTAAMPGASPFWRIVAMVGFIAALAAAAVLSPAVTPSAAERRGDAAFAVPFTAARLADLRAQGKPVFVDFTAAWCITCLVNERLALSRPEVAEVFRSGRVAFLKADWTNRDPDITAALHALGRDGVPVYAVYPPQGSPFLLPQVLTPRVVLDALAGF